MHFHQRRCCFAILLTSLSLTSVAAPALADDDDAKLIRRISELEAENRALRIILAEIQKSIETIPEQELSANAKTSGLRIIVAPGDWGASSLPDITKVCNSAGNAILSQLGDDGFAPIVVQKDKSGPITLYRRGAGNEHIVRLNTGDRAWAQFAFQFAHEFCHIVCNYRNVKNKQLWFEETLCECASLYSLRQMATEWKTDPPYSNWKEYSSALADYAQNRLDKHQGRTESVADFYRSHVADLEKSGTNRELNDFIAARLLPLFESHPQGWRTLRYLNLGPEQENSSFTQYLTGWLSRVPEKDRPFVEKVAEKFRIEISKTPSGK